ncbi:hypothetical protein OIU79_007610 [Salix purpurea]|uniref:Uncharacterized protein n=1 Tax=Salix purpurea TaxID=77065 RepID=A0A9Q0YV18_SALPP|nr:hypothetical protein OIU79_007610 [Salix purpurea]
MGDSEAGHLTHVTTQVKGTMVSAKHPYMYSKDAFDYSGGFPVPKLEPL